MLQLLLLLPLLLSVVHLRICLVSTSWFAELLLSDAACRYFDMLRDIGSSNRSSTLFLPHSPAGMTDLSSQIR